MGNAGMTGLGGGARTLLDGQPSGNKVRDDLVRKFSKDVYETFFKGTKIDYKGVDAQVDEEEVSAGIEPSYMYDPLKIITLRKEKKMSEIKTGFCFGPWGSGVRMKSFMYCEYKKKSKFVKFVDKWHSILFQDKLSTV